MNMVRVELTLIDVSAEVSKDKYGYEIQRLIASTLAACVGAQELLLSNEPECPICWCYMCCLCPSRPPKMNPELTDHLQQISKRYVRVSDKYLRFLSLMLKNEAFLDAYPNVTSDFVVNLPRTLEGKPFIPTPEGMPSDHHLSVSHQFPFAGVATMSDSEVKLGLDIVVFDEYNRELYKSELDYVKVFRNSFTENEWDSILANRGNELREMYLRWSIKEAYTKALGVGMGLDFNSFETCLDGVDSLWNMVRNRQSGVYVNGLIKRLDKDQFEFWNFFFLTLVSDDKTGYACICAGPKTNEEIELSVHTVWTPFNDFIDPCQARIKVSMDSEMQALNPSKHGENDKIPSKSTLSPRSNSPNKVASR